VEATEHDDRLSPRQVAEHVCEQCCLLVADLQVAAGVDVTGEA